MHLPFTVDEFLAVFARYNERVWPMQLILVGLGLAAVAVAGRPARRNGASRLVAALLGVLWAWMGLVYHIGFFRAINPAAVLFGIAFVTESVLLLAYGVLGDRLHFRFHADAGGWLGAALLTYALAVYPLLAIAFGHAYPRTPTFGLPCPTTIFTLGLLSWTRPPIPWAVLVVPIAWSFLGTSAAATLGMWEDLGLGLAAALFLLIHVRAPRPRRAATR